MRCCLLCLDFALIYLCVFLCSAGFGRLVGRVGQAVHNILYVQWFCLFPKCNGDMRKERCCGMVFLQHIWDFQYIILFCWITYLHMLAWVYLPTHISISIRNTLLPEHGSRDAKLCVFSMSLNFGDRVLKCVSHSVNVKEPINSSKCNPIWEYA